MMDREDLPAYILGLMEGPVPPSGYACDGCTFSPDVLGGMDCRPACFYHDFAYKLGGGKRERLRADRTFYRNLRRCDVPRSLATLYFFEVRTWGNTAFTWTTEPRPRFWRAFLETFFTRWGRM